MCVAADIYAQKFGYQRALDYTGVTPAQKTTIGFRTTVYYPTNWHNSQYQTWKAKFPAFLRYGGMVAVPPEYIQKNFIGIYPVGQQPTIDDSKPYQIPRLS